MTEQQMQIRKRLESYVLGGNKYLREVIETMSIPILLRNAQPIYRPDFARECERVKLITSQEAKEFVLILKSPLP